MSTDLDWAHVCPSADSASHVPFTARAPTVAYSPRSSTWSCPGTFCSTQLKKTVRRVPCPFVPYKATPPTSKDDRSSSVVFLLPLITQASLIFGSYHLPLVDGRLFTPPGWHRPRPKPRCGDARRAALFLRLCHLLILVASLAGLRIHRFLIILSPK